MRRIGLAALLTLSFLAPLAAEEKTAGKIARIGIIGTSGPAALSAGAEPSSPYIAALLRGLRDLGYTYGRDFVTEPSVSAVSRMLPGAASCSIRAARCVVWPTAV
jgi:hypothetical protein